MTPIVRSLSCNSITPEQDCANGQDDDGDGLTDCDDTDCASNPIRASSEDCTNGIDDDGDDVTALIPIVRKHQPASPETNQTASMELTTTAMD